MLLLVQCRKSINFRRQNYFSSCWWQAFSRIWADRSRPSLSKRASKGLFLKLVGFSPKHLKAFLHQMNCWIIVPHQPWMQIERSALRICNKPCTIFRWPSVKLPHHFLEKIWLFTSLKTQTGRTDEKQVLHKNFGLLENATLKQKFPDFVQKL